MANNDTEPKWYIIHTYSGYETMVQDSLKRLIENNNLQDSIVDVKIPTEKTIEEKANGKKKVVERKLLPCYVFIKMIYSNQLWYLVTNTRGVTGFCGPQGRPIPMKKEEIRKMRLDEYVDDADFKIGDKVSIMSGPLEGFVGTIRELDEVGQRARVDIVMFGRNVYPLSYLWSALLTLLFSVLVNLVMGRKLKNISMVESMKAPE